MTYSGSPNSYFRQLPDLDYPSLANDRTSVYDYRIVKNIFKRAVMRDDIFNDITAFTKYSVQGDERADQIAESFYGDSGLDWVVLTTNNIVHVRDEWPMGAQDFLTYINGKYTVQELTNIHHYETKIIRDSANNLIQPAGLYVDSNHSMTYVDSSSTTFTKSERWCFVHDTTAYCVPIFTLTCLPYFSTLISFSKLLFLITMPYIIERQ